MLNIDIWNIASTVISLLVPYIFMKHFLIDSVHKVLDEGKQMTERDLGDARSTRIEVEQMKASYEVSTGKTEEEASRIIKSAKPRARDEYSRTIARAREDVAKRMEGTDKAIAPEREKAMNDLKVSVARLAMSTTAELLSERNGPENDGNPYNRSLVESGDRDD